LTGHGRPPAAGRDMGTPANVIAAEPAGEDGGEPRRALDSLQDA